MSRRPTQPDAAGLGRGPYTRWFPVFWQAEQSPPRFPDVQVDGTMSPRAFTARIAVSTPRLTVPAAGLAVGGQICRALIPVLMGLAIDRALASNDALELSMWMAFLAADFLLLSLALRYGSQLTNRAAQLVEHRLRSTLSRRVIHPTTRHSQRTDGAILDATTSDVTRLAKAVNLTVYPVGELAALGFIAAVLLTMHWPLGLAVLLGGPLVVWSMGALSAPFARRARAYHTLLAAAVGRAADLVSGYRVIRGIRAEGEAVRRYRHSSRAALGGARRYVASLGVYLAGSNSLSGLFVTCIAGLAGFFAVSGDLTIGQLITAVGLAQAILPPLTALTANAGVVWAAAVASGGRVLDLLLDAGSRDAECLPRPTGVDHGAYEPGPDDPTIRRVRMRPALTLRGPGRDRIEISPGEMVGISCDDHSAMELVTALLNPRELVTERGVESLLDGVPAALLEDVEYRSRVVVAPHSATLFRGTVAENLTTPRTDRGRLVSALGSAACDDFIDATDEGLVTGVGENAGEFSGGQRQRLALARAIAADAPILVLHEPTTAVDPVTESAIASRLRDARGDATTLLVTTSPALLGICDRVVIGMTSRETQHIGAGT